MQKFKCLECGKVKKIKRKKFKYFSGVTVRNLNGKIKGRICHACTNKAKDKYITI